MFPTMSSSLDCESRNFNGWMNPPVALEMSSGRVARLHRLNRQLYRPGMLQLALGISIPCYFLLKRFLSWKTKVSRLYYVNPTPKRNNRESNICYFKFNICPSNHSHNIQKFQGSFLLKLKSKITSTLLYSNTF